MYAAVADPYCYKGTEILKNRPGLRDARQLGRFEAAMTAQRAEEPFPPGRLSVAHYCAVHHHLFQDVYRWAGRFRVIRMGKGNSMFCYPENVRREMAALFGRLRAWGYLQGTANGEFASRAAAFLADLNAIHCFRDGNGRCQLAFMAMVANHAGHPFKLQRLRPRRFLAAMIRSFGGDLDPLADELRRLIA